MNAILTAVLGNLKLHYGTYAAVVAGLLLVFLGPKVGIVSKDQQTELTAALVVCVAGLLRASQASQGALLKKHVDTKIAEANKVSENTTRQAILQLGGDPDSDVRNKTAKKHHKKPG